MVVDGGDHKMKGKTDWWEIERLSKRFPRWYEREQTRVGVQSVKSWAAEGNLDSDDLFVSGNADEVPLYLNIYVTANVQSQLMYTLAS